MSAYGLSPSAIADLMERHARDIIRRECARFEERIAAVEKKVDTAQEETILIRVLRRLIQEETAK